MSAPRTWILGAYRGELERGGIASGPKLKNESIKVIEAEPVLDLLERVEGFLGVPDYVLASDVEGGEKAMADVEALLREHGRLEGRP